MRRINPMTTATALPETVATPQDIAILNLNMLMQLEGKYRKDLAEYMGKRPQNLSRMMTGDSNWAFNDMVRAAEFVGVSVGSLLDPSLTPAKALSIIGERRNDNDNGDGGLLVGVDAGRRQRGSGVIFTLAA